MALKGVSGPWGSINHLRPLRFSSDCGRFPHAASLNGADVGSWHMASESHVQCMKHATEGAG